MFQPVGLHLSIINNLYMLLLLNNTSGLNVYISTTFIYIKFIMSNVTNDNSFIYVCNFINPCVTCIYIITKYSSLYTYILCRATPVHEPL